MAVLKCKMCGGDLNIEEGMSVCECEYCGTKQTIPVIDDEKKLKLFERANKLRANCEFDKAAGVYESIVAEYSEEAEGYWGLILCRYGIEYVDDPATGRKIATCHRSSFDSVMDDEDFELVMENSDAVSRAVYREEAKYIEEIRKGIIEVSGKEEPYDIFICYKETDEEGNRTLDSVMAQDVYNALTDKGYRVFFSRISLEDKLGVEYEPYIFAALNSAKIMLAFGTSYDYYNAVWVKNEWSRYLKLMAKDKTKHLIPCFKNVDAYDIPKEFAKLQAQDMGKIGALQDLLHGIDKLIAPESSTRQTSAQDAVIYSQAGPNGDALLKRGFMALEDHEWNKATGFFEQVLDRNAENGWAYWGELLAEQKSDGCSMLAQNLNTKLSSNMHTNSLTVEYSDYYKECQNKYFFMEIFSKKEINNLFYEVYTYNSAVESVEKIISDNKEKFILADNKLYQRACQYADAELNNEIDNLRQLIDDYLMKLHDEVKEKERVEKEKKEKIIAARFAKLFQCLDEVTITASANAEKNEKTYQEDLAKWEKEERELPGLLEKYEADYEKWRIDYELPMKQWEEAKAKYASDKDELEKEIEEGEIELDDIEGFRAEARRRKKEAEILTLKNRLKNLEAPKPPVKGTIPIKPVLRKKPSMSFSEKVGKTEVLEQFYSLWRK